MISNTPSQRLAAYLAGLIQGALILTASLVAYVTGDLRHLCYLVVPVLMTAWEVTRFVCGRRNERAHRAWERAVMREGAR